MNQELNKQSGSAVTVQELEEGEKSGFFRKVTFGTLNFLYNIVFITLMLLLLLFAGYARWDSQQVYTQADPIQFIQYKPSPPEMISFEELQRINPDVIGWLTVYDTNIDYPLVIGEDNEKYLTRNVMLETANSGALFLDSRNSRDFSDFNTIIFGHHMGHHEMFGDLDLFLKEDFWNEHEFGNLIYDSQNHGLQFVAMLQCDAYDWTIYKPGVQGESARVRYINHIYETAKYVRGIDTERLREIQEDYQKRLAAAKKAGTPTSEVGSDFAQARSAPVTPDDKLVLLSTCSAEITNGRFILVAKVLDHPVENPFPDNTINKVNTGIDTAKISAKIGRWSAQTWILILIILILIVLALYVLSTYLYKRKLEEGNGVVAHDQNTENR